MPKQEKTRNDFPDNEPMKAAPKPTEEETVSDEQLDQVAGGFNPQPDPPGFQARLVNQINQFGKLFHR